MKESINTIANFEVDPTVDVDVVDEVVFVNELLGDAGQLDVDVLWSVKWGLEVEVIDVRR